MSISGLRRLEGFFGHALEDKFRIERENRRQDVIVIPIQVRMARRGLPWVAFLSDKRDDQVGDSLSAKSPLAFWRPVKDWCRAKASSTMLPIKSA